MKKGAVFNDAFLVCHEIYVAARELVKFARPDDATAVGVEAPVAAGPASAACGLCRGLCAGRRAGFRRRRETRTLKNEGCGTHAGSSLYRGRSGARQTSNASRASRLGCGARQHHYAVPRASRLIPFRMYYLIGAEYEAARHLLGLSERTWSD